VKIEKAKQLTSRKFKRMTGVSRRTFELMVELVKGNAQKKKKPGRRPKLIIEDQVLMVIQKRERVPYLLSYWIRLGTFRVGSLSNSF
jgi:hypothetical protein